MSVARADSETPQRLVARLLAYCLCWEPDLAFTGGVGSGDEPDVWLREPGGRTRLWIEVGAPDPKRLVKAAREANLQGYLRAWLGSTEQPRSSVKLHVDVDPYSFL